MRRPLALVAALASASLGLGLGAAAAATAPPGTAGATPVTGAVEPARPSFYEPPATITGAPGTILRSEDAPQVLAPLGLSTAIAKGQRVMYVSRDRAGVPIAVTGIVITPRTPWLGLGARPLISYAAGTQGMADRCAPSRQLAEGVEYENLGFDQLLTRGYAVAMTDYQGLGTPGSHTYMIRAAQAHAVLDMTRAAQRLTGSGVSSSSPVGLMGYSQGGGAVAAAAELAGTYAPELRIRGTLAGAVPADLVPVADNLDGGPFAAFLLYAVVGQLAAYDLDPATVVDPAGLDLVRGVEGSCVFDLLDYAFLRSEGITVDGRPVTDLLAEEPFAAIEAENLIGNRRPNAPVVVDHSLLDDTIPYAVGRAMAQRWCERGANVRFETNATPTHVGGMANHVARALPFFEARFAGVPQVSNCWTL